MSIREFTIPASADDLLLAVAVATPEGGHGASVRIREDLGYLYDGGWHDAVSRC